MRDIIPLTLLALTLGLPAGAQATDRNPDTDWMSGKVGIFTHFLVNETGFKDLDKYDAEAVANQAAECGAAWFGLTLGQNSGWYISPNATYEKLAGYAPHERCSARDIPMELALALKKRGIRFLLYLPCQTPNQDLKAAGAFGLDATKKGDRVIMPAFAEKWAKVIEEWSVRYGDLVSAWWFDGGYQHCNFTEADAALYAAAVKKGNPHAVVAFNPGVRLIRAKAADDYTAGESNSPFRETCNGRWLKDVQWQVFTFLGKYWGNPALRYTDAEWSDWLRTVTSAGGAVMLDVAPAHPTGVIQPAPFQQLKAIIRSNH